MIENEKLYLPDPSRWKGTWRDDWRIMGQEGYLLNKRLQYRRFDRKLIREDYDQCEFCWAIFDEDKLHPVLAYFEPIGQHWICEECFKDFEQHFNWTVEKLDV